MSDDLETEIAEAMGDEETEVSEPEPEPEADEEADEEVAPNLEPDPTQYAHLEMEKRDAWGKRAGKYLQKGMDEAFGEDSASYLECPFCNYSNTPGFLHASPCPPELLGTVYEWTNTTAPDDFLPDTASHICPACNGLGAVATGSKVGGQQTLACITCKGKGWEAVGPEREAGFLAAANGSTFVATELPGVGPGSYTPSGDEPEFVAAAKAAGYTVIPPFVASV